jgi:Calcineurin-like phosphoesterase
MNAILDVEPPQLVVLNGDLITGENTYLANSSLYLDEIVKPLVERGLCWASTYGNHDSNYNLSSQVILEREHGYPNSRTESMVSSPNAGVTNYYLPVFPSDEKQNEPELVLWFFDSRGGRHYQEHDRTGHEISYSGYVDESVVTWFRETNTALKHKWRKKIPSLAFVHIPTNAVAAFQTMGVSPTNEPGINDDNPLAQQGVTNGAYTGADIPFMSALLETEGLIAVFSGHDHGDDWCFKWGEDEKLPGMDLRGNGMCFCFGRHTGYGGYGNWARGSRQILLREEKNLGKETETWIRLENGRAQGRVVLNETYGKDVYLPVTEVYA